MVARVRVEAKENPYLSNDERFRILMYEFFKVALPKSGVQAEYKKKEHFESKSRIHRRKKRESIARIRKEEKKKNYAKKT